MLHDMKPEIIPAILTKKRSEFEKRLALAAGLSRTVQIDIMDGYFVGNRTPRNLNNSRWFGEWLMKLPNGIRVPDIELHLMVMDPWPLICAWQEYAEVKRAIWHIEVPLDHAELIDVVHGLGLQAGLAINPGTPLDELTPFLKNKPTVPHSAFADEALVMGVRPGFSGQLFRRESLKTVRALRRAYPRLDIGIDGGVGLDNAAAIIKAGADRLNAAGAIFLALDPKQAYRKLTTPA